MAISWNRDEDGALLDRLVDGELTPAERRELLAALDSKPDGWRRCALAFLEAQSWAGAFERLTAASPMTAGGGASGAGGEAVALRSSDVAVEAAVRPARRGRYAQGGAWLTTAAAVVVAFGLGWQSGQDNPTQTPAIVQAKPEQIDAAPFEGGGKAADGDAITLVVNDRNGARHRLQVPLVEGRRLGDLADAPQWSDAPALRRRLEQLGLDMQARRRYAPLYFEQEDRIVPMVVPVDDAYVMPVKRHVF